MSLAQKETGTIKTLKSTLNNICISGVFIVSNKFVSGSNTIYNNT